MENNKTQEKNQEKIKVENEDKKDISKTKFNKKLILIGGVGFIFVIIILILGILGFLQPTIQVDKEAEKINLETYTINSNTGYPEISFEEGQKITFASGKEVVAQNYELKEEDFGEGNNLITTKYFLDLFFIKFEGKNSVETEFFVDRIKPNLELKTVFNEGEVKYFTGETIPVDFVSEKGAKFFVNGEEVDEFVQENQTFEISVVTGENNFEFVSKDQNGNLSNPKKVNFEGVKMVEYASNDGFKTKISYPEGWEIKEGKDGSSLDISLKKDNTTLKYDLFAITGPTGFYIPTYCTNNKNLIYDVGGNWVRIGMYEKKEKEEFTADVYLNENKFLYKNLKEKGLTYSEIKNTEGSSKNWFQLYSGMFDAPPKEDTGIIIDYENEMENYNFCVQDLTTNTGSFEHGFPTNFDSYPIGVYTITVGFEGEINENLLKEADLIVSKTEIGDEETEII